MKKNASLLEIFYFVNVFLKIKIKISVEIGIVESYLPTQLSVEEIQSKIDALVMSGVKDLGMIMKEFNSLPADKKIVSELAKKSIV
jgi:uncharacterized protein YqeY